MTTCANKTWADLESRVSSVLERMLLDPEIQPARFVAGNVRMALTSDATDGSKTAAAWKSEGGGGGEAEKAPKHYKRIGVYGLGSEVHVGM